MSEALTIALSTIGFTIVVLCPFIFNKYLKFKLEVEKMRLEAEVRKEEIRAKNQLDIEKMMIDDRDYRNTIKKPAAYDVDILQENRSERLRY